MMKVNHISTLSLLLTLLAVVTACSSDDDLKQQHAVPLNIASLGNSALRSGDTPSGAKISYTRATAGSFIPGTGGSDDLEDVPSFLPYNLLYPYSLNTDYTTIGCFLTQDTYNRYESVAGYFQWLQDNSWKTTVGIVPGNFFIFGYMPSNQPGMTVNINKRTDSGTWADGCIMTFKNLSTVTPADVCVVVGVLKGTADKYDINDATNVVPNLKQGVYAYEGTETDNYAYLLLEHLYTNVNLELAVEQKYSQLRTIVLKEVLMKSTTASNVNVEVRLGKDHKKPVENVEYKNSVDAGLMSAVLFREYGAKAPRIAVEGGTPTNVPGYFAPGMTLQEFDFEFIYDVYDKAHPDDPNYPYGGNRVRENCHAINHWSLTGIQVESGLSFNVTATIKPTYLYQLSEPDLDNPTIVLKTEPNP